MKVTIKDIAKKCGVSIATVSRVVNGSKDGVGDDTRRRVQKEVDANGYQPSLLAQSMVTKVTKTIALIIPDICNPFFPELAKGITDACDAKGYHLFLCNTDSSTEKEQEQVAFLRERLVDGIVFTTQNTTENDQLIKDLIDENFPIVTIERYMHKIKVPLQIHIDNEGGIVGLINYLVECGHKKIAYIGGPEYAENANRRLIGYKKALAINNIKVDKSIMVTGDYKVDLAYKLTSNLLSTVSDRFTAILAANDLMAIGACNAVIDAGLSVPNDISIAGFDNLPLTRMMQPRITTSGVSIYDLGQKAASLLLTRLEGDHEHKQLFLPCTIEKRSSVKTI